MKILAASIVEKVSGFLHAGYISAHPREMEINFISINNAKIQLDVAQALQLKGETVAGVTQTVDTGSIANAVSIFGHWPTLLLATTGFFAFIGFMYLLKNKWKDKRPLTALSIMTILLTAFTITCGTINTTPPWEGLALQEYENPEDATLAILHGILGPAAENGHMHELILATVQDEVALPTNNLTEGMQYALQTYGIDGWGKEFRIIGEDESDSEFEVTSAGEDGIFDTEDDIEAGFYKRDNSNFDFPSAIFLGKHNETLLLLFHRFNGSLFEYWYEDRAKEMTGNDYFDCIFGQMLGESLNQSMETAYNETSKDKNYDPLILYVL